MTSPKQAAANRRNAQRSTGPRSVDGKVVSARNALRHGVVSRVEVLPGLEDADAYEEHVRRTHEALVPVGYLEETLADRISSVTWRLGRAVRAERDLAAARMERLDESQNFVAGAPSREALARNVEAAGWALEVVSSWPDDLDDQDAALLLEELQDGLDDDGGAVVACAEEEQGTSPWNTKQLRKVVRDALEADGFEGGAEEFFRARLEAAREALAAFDARHERRLRLAVLPAFRELEPLARYETTLERSLFRALHELQRLQAVRAGNAVPPPVAVDVTVSTDRDLQ